MTPIRHIVFDVGQVLVFYDPELPFLQAIPDQQRRRWFLDNVCTSAWNIEQDRGRSWAEAETLAIAAHPEWENEIRHFRRGWRQMIDHSLDDSVALMASLIAAGHDVTLLTNFAADTFVEARGIYPFLNSTRGITVSGEIGAIKPERAIYDHHARTFGLDPAATLFIDDSAKNVDGAIAAGWQAVQFTGVDRLQVDLNRLGIPVPVQGAGN